jgi:hypothetical protein
MSALKTTADEPVLPAQPIEHDQAGALLAQIMGLVEQGHHRHRPSAQRRAR